MKIIHVGFVCALFPFLGCAHSRPKDSLASHVDLQRFMGAWHVIASIPVSIEKESYNGVESYQLEEKGRIQTTYTFNKGSSHGPLKTYRPIGTVYNHDTNSEWRMQFIWPFKAAYLIHYVDDNYATTIVGDGHLNHVWIMSRAPHLSDADFVALVSRVDALGYDTTRLRLVPQN